MVFGYCLLLVWGKSLCASPVGLSLPKQRRASLQWPVAQDVCANCGLSAFRKNAVELELAKCKMDMMSLNSQLLDAIQQKLNLSQQLEAWQVNKSPEAQAQKRLQES